MVALGKNWIRRKNLQGVSCKQAAQQATQRRHVRSLYCVVPNPPHTCTPHNKALCPSHSARHSIIFILWFDRCCNPFAASCKDIAIRHRRRGCNIAKHIGIRHRRKPYRAAGRQRLWNCGSTSKELLTMEYQSNVQYASCFPPRLEDAGLEDCALPLEKIQEAFRLAAEKMHTAAESVVEVLGVQGIKENDDGICVPDTKGANGQWGDSLVDDSDGIRGLVDSCVDTHTGGILEEGKDAVVDSGIEGKEDKLVGGIGDVGPKLGEGGCIAGDLGGLGGVPGVISTPERKTHDDDDDEPKGPTLAGVTL